MKARNQLSAFAKVAGSALFLLLTAIAATSFLPAPPAEGIIEKAFKLDNGARESIDLAINQAGAIQARAEWAPQKAELALILFGPGQMNYYRRSDGKSPLELNYAVTALDTADGTAWRLKLINQSGEMVEGMLRITYPAQGKEEELPLQ